jgi:lysine-ketoglutarate reductase/saccharopine dehydrogenase-like protein (TIGR00300 family)
MAIKSVQLKQSPKDGVFPFEYYTTSNKKTKIFFEEKWIEVEHPEMDKGIVVDKSKHKAFCRVGNEIKKGDWVVVGEDGVDETSIEKEEDKDFGFMKSEVSGERSKEVLIAKIADTLRDVKAKKGRVLFVGGPAIIHTGASKYLAALIREGYISVLFAGNALATHDLEHHVKGTSLGVHIATAMPVKNGHHHHLHVINKIRYYGGIKQAVKNKYITGGIMYECVKHKVRYILAGSIRDDGPLPDVFTDSVEAQRAMRLETRKGFNVALMVATLLHSVATGNLLTYDTQKFIVDDNIASVTKLADRGTNAVGMVTDCVFFLGELCRQLGINT